MEMTIRDIKAVRDTFPYNIYCVYLVRNGDCVIYIGKSNRNVIKRLREHIGAASIWPSSLGLHILENAPHSEDWNVELFTVEDCGPVIKWYNPMYVNWDVDTAEECMISFYRPLLNGTHNYDRPRWVECVLAQLCAGPDAGGPYYFCEFYGFTRIASKH